MQLNLQVIVVDSADKARQILDRLQKGEDFTALARCKHLLRLRCLAEGRGCRAAP